MASFASSATTCGARKHAWTKTCCIGQMSTSQDSNQWFISFLLVCVTPSTFSTSVHVTTDNISLSIVRISPAVKIQFSLVQQTNLNYEREQFWREKTGGRLVGVLPGRETWSSDEDKTELTNPFSQFIPKYHCSCKLGSQGNHHADLGINF